MAVVNIYPPWDNYHADDGQMTWLQGIGYIDLDEGIAIRE